MDKLKELAIAVEAMRKAQNEYFARKTADGIRYLLLDDSKNKEKLVDAMVKEILHTPSLF